jgi:tetratricopeptide (TPR) repeat protein
MAQKKGLDPENRLVAVVVEDQINMRHAMKRIIESTGIFRVEEFPDSREALEYLKANLVDLVVCDIFLTKGNGFDVLKQIRSRAIANEIPVIFVSGESVQTDIVQAIEQGVTSYIIKPFESDDLIHKVVTSVKNFRNPSEKIKKLRLADSHYLKGLYEHAALEFREVLDENPESVRAMVGLALTKQKMDRHAEAIDLCLRAISLMPLYYQAHSVISDVYIEQRNYKEALKHLKQELAINGKQIERRILFAEILLSCNFKSEAVNQMRIAIKDFPTEEIALLKMAETLLKTEDFEKSIHYFQKTRRRNPNSTKALDGISDVCIKMNEPTRAARIFRDVLERTPKQKDALLALSRLYELEGKYSEALHELESYISTGLPPLEAHLAKARIFLKMGQKEEAQELWNLCLQVSLNSDTLHKISLQCIDAKFYKKATNFLEKSLSLNPDNKKVRYTLACVLEARGLVSEAVSIYTQLAHGRPTFWDAWQALSRISNAQKKEAV